VASSVDGGLEGVRPGVHQGLSIGVQAGTNSVGQNFSWVLAKVKELRRSTISMISAAGQWRPPGCGAGTLEAGQD